jgi:hypothetical protein
MANHSAGDIGFQSAYGLLQALPLAACLIRIISDIFPFGVIKPAPVYIPYACLMICSPDMTHVPL